MKKAFAVFFALLFFSLPAFAALQYGALEVFAITDDGAALTAALSVQITRGTGRIWTSVTPLVGTSTQATERIAVGVAKKYSSDVEKYDYLFDINSDASLVEGPSAGSAMALLVISMLQDKQLQPHIGITGTITEDGLIGNVGGVFEKSKEAARIGIKLFMVPPGETQQIIREGGLVRSINLSTYALDEWGMKVVEVATIDDVLEYAFTEVGAIDINKTRGQIPEFVPDPITFSPDLVQMHAITKRLIENAEQEVKDAKAALSTTLLRDTRALEVLLKSLSAAESDAKQARLLADQNYLFSAANYAFLAKVNASLVRQISEKPSILGTDSVVFELRLLNLKKELEALKKDLASFIAVEKLEWHIAAQQRLSWAELKVQQLESKTTIIIGPESSETEVVLARVLDLEFASAWLGVAKEFFAISLQSERKAIIDDFFRNDFDSYLVQAESGLNAVKGDAASEAQEKIDTARIKKNYKWFASASFDAVFSIALSKAQLFSEGKNLEELKEKLNTGISGLDSQIAETNNSFIWAQLYLDHARYFSKAVSYYESFGQVSRAADAARNGITLLFLAENLFEVTAKLKSHYSNLPKEKFFSGATQAVVPVENPFETTGFYYGALVFVFILLLILVAGMLQLLKNTREHMQLSTGKQISNLNLMQSQVETLFAQKSLPKKEYEKQKRLLGSKMKNLVSKKENISAAFVSLSRLKPQLLSCKLALKKIRKHHAKGIITDSHFRETEKELQKQIKQAMLGIKRQESIIDAEKNLSFNKNI